MGVKIVFFDCDGTLTDVKSSWQYLHERLNLWEGNAEEYQRLFHTGAIGYEEFCRKDAALWKGRPIEEIESIVGEIRYNEGVVEALRTLKKKGIFTVILSTGLTILIDRVKAELGVSLAIANELVARDGLLTGEIRINVDHGHKGFWVRKLLAEGGFRKGEAAAVGDSEGDKEMFDEVGLAIGYRPSNGLLPYVRHALHDDSFAHIVKVIQDDEPPGP